MVRRLKEKIKEKIKHHFHEVLKVKKSSHSIAIGFAIGTLISILPTPGLNLILALLVILVYENVSKLSLIGSIFFWNPLTLTPIYLLSYQIGDILFQDLAVKTINITMLDQIYYFSRRFLVGNVILAVALSITSYFVVKKIIDVLHVRKIIKESERHHKEIHNF